MLLLLNSFLEDKLIFPNSIHSKRVLLSNFLIVSNKQFYLSRIGVEISVELEQATRKVSAV